MSINRQSFLAFASELTKLSGPVEYTRGLLREGWHGSPGMGGPTGTLGKAMTIGGTALMLPGAVSQEDPTGQGRSRAERVTDLAGQTAGGLAGSALASRAVGKLNWQAPTRAPGTSFWKGMTGARIGKGIGRNVLNLGGAMGAAYLGGKLLSLPARLALGRKRPQQSGDEPSPNPGLHGTPAETPIAQEGQQGQMR